MESPDALVAWEAQFGDFANGAQIIIDNFFVAAEDKWGQRSGLVLLLPHGFEGQGPEHSSARIERFLTLSARDNMRLAQPTTAAQYFHLLRSQVRGLGRQPLVVFTPKSLLRARQSRSPIDELTVGSFVEVIDDPATDRSLHRDAAPPVDPEAVRRVLLCSGKVAFDAMARRDALAAGEPGLPTPGRRRRPQWPWSGSSSSIPGPKKPWRRSSVATPTPIRWCGCRKSPRTWGRGRSRTDVCTACCGTGSR